MRILARYVWVIERLDNCAAIADESFSIAVGHERGLIFLTHKLPKFYKVLSRDLFHTMRCVGGA